MGIQCPVRRRPRWHAENVYPPELFIRAPGSVLVFKHLGAPPTGYLWLWERDHPEHSEGLMKNVVAEGHIVGPFSSAVENFLPPGWNPMAQKWGGRSHVFASGTRPHGTLRVLVWSSSHVRSSAEFTLLCTATASDVDEWVA